MNGVGDWTVELELIVSVMERIIPLSPPNSAGIDFEGC